MVKKTFMQMNKVFSVMVSVLLAFSNPAYSLPQVAQVVSGSASITQSGNTMTINATDKTVVNYSSFNIAAGESVVVKLPSDASSILNRVIGSSASQILGNLTSNGLFILVNTNGVYIGSQATINATNLIISTRDINNQDFFKGNYFFQKMTPGQVDTLLENHGTINIKEGGFGVLIAGGINNKGTIIASLGKVALASGDAVQLNMGSGNGLISVAIDQKVASQIKDINGNPITNQIDNSGNIQAEVVMLDAESLPNIFSSAINTQGTIQANGAVNGQNGQITLTANNPVNIGGTISSNSLSLNASSGDLAHYILNSGTSVNLTGDFSIGQGSTVDAGNAYIGVGGNWLDSGIFNGGTSTVEFTSPNTAQILGNNIFYNFESMVPNKILEFQAGDLQTILGLWKIQGAYGQHERLVSTQPGVQWLSNSVGTRDLTYAWVQDGNNINANKIVMTQSTNRGNSPGWDPRGTWTDGGGDGNWSNAANWSGLGGATPGAGDTAAFDGTSIDNSTVDSSFGGSVGEIGMYPGYTGTLSLGRNLTVTNASGNAGDITLQSGTLVQGAHSLRVVGDYLQTGGTFVGDSTGNDLILGSLRLSGGSFKATSGTLTVNGNVDLSGTGTFSNNGGTFMVDATSNTIFGPSGNTFNNLTLLRDDNSATNTSITVFDNAIVGGSLLVQNNNAGSGSLSILSNGTAKTWSLKGNMTVSSATGSAPLTVGDSAFTFDFNASSGFSFTSSYANATTAGTLQFDSSGNLFTQTAGAITGNLAVNGTLQLGSNYNGTGASQNLSIFSGGVLDLNGNNLTYSNPVSFLNIGRVKAVGTETVTNLTNDSTSGGTIEYTGKNTYSGALPFGNNYFTVDFSGSGSTWNLSAPLTSAYLSIDLANIKVNANGQATTTTGSLNTLGTFLASTGTQNIANLVVNSGGTFTGSSGAVNITSGGVTINQYGTLTAPTGAFNVKGGWTNSGTFIPGTGTVTFTGSGTDTLDSGGASFNNVNVNYQSGGTLRARANPLTLSGNLTISGGTLQLGSNYNGTGASQNLTIASGGTFDLNGNNLIYTNPSTFSNNGILQLNGNETITNLSNDTTHGTVQYNGTGTYSSLVFGNTYNNLTLSGTGAFSLNHDLTVNGNLTQGAGTMDTNGKNMTVTGTSAIGGNYLGSTGKQTYNGGLTINGTYTGSSGIVTTTDLTINSAGTMTAPNINGELDVSGNWTNNGIFNNNNGTVLFNGAGNQTVVGSTAFNNFTMANNYTDGATVRTLTLPAGLTTTLQGTILLLGNNPNNPLKIASSIPGQLTTINASNDNDFAVGFVNFQDTQISTGKVTISPTTVLGRTLLAALQTGTAVSSPAVLASSDSIDTGGIINSTNQNNNSPVVWLTGNNINSLTPSIGPTVSFVDASGGGELKFNITKIGDNGAMLGGNNGGDSGGLYHAGQGFGGDESMPFVLKQGGAMQEPADNGGSRTLGLGSPQGMNDTSNSTAVTSQSSYAGRNSGTTVRSVNNGFYIPALGTTINPNSIINTNTK